MNQNLFKGILVLLTSLAVANCTNAKLEKKIIKPAPAADGQGAGAEQTEPGVGSTSVDQSETSGPEESEFKKNKINKLDNLKLKLVYSEKAEIESDLYDAVLNESELSNYFEDLLEQDKLKATGTILTIKGGLVTNISINNKKFKKIEYSLCKDFQKSDQCKVSQVEETEIYSLNGDEKKVLKVSSVSLQARQIEAQLINKFSTPVGKEKSLELLVEQEGTSYLVSHLNACNQAGSSCSTSLKIYKVTK